MANNPLVSIITPMFNAANTISGTIRSVQAQTYQDWEMLVVDDCSTDNSREIVRQFIRNERRIRLLESDYNFGGPARPRNIGMMNSAGEYLAFLDSDDLWLPDRLKMGVDFLEGNKEYFLAYSKCFIKANGKISRVLPQKANSGNIFNQLYLEHNFIGCLTVMMRNQKGCGQYFFPEDKRFISVEDYLLWLSIARKNKIGFIEKPLGIYVIRRNSISGGLFKILRCLKLALDEFAPFVPKRILIAAYFSFYRKFIEMGSKQILKQAAAKFMGGIMNVGRIQRIVCMLICDPKQFFLRFKAKAKSLFIFRKAPFEKALKGGVVFRFDFDYDPAVKNMYLGIYEIETVWLIKRALKNGSTFIDVGANIGYLSTIALRFVGTAGQVHSFEPVPEYFLRLRDVTRLNPKYNITVNQCALGEVEGSGKIAITNLQNIGWNTMVPGLMTKETTKEIQEVPIRRLDGYIKEKALTNVALIKIDTEGFEFPVLKGLKRYFESHDKLPPIICEVAPSAYHLFGYELKELSEYMKKFNYDSFRVANPKKRIDITNLKETTNVLFLHCRRI